MRSLYAALLLVSPIWNAWGAEIHVPADFPTIQEALDVATPGCEVLVASGTYDESLTISTGNVALRAEEVGGATIRHLLRTVMVSADSVTVAGFVIECTQQVLGGAQALVVQARAFKSVNNVYRGGGECVVVEGTAHFLNDRIRGARTGLAIEGDSGTTAKMESCVVEDNVATGFLGGGAAVLGNSSLMLTDCVFRRNQALGGSALVAETSPGFPKNTNVSALRCVFYSNEAAIGTVMSIGADVSLVSCTFWGNTITNVEAGVIDVGGSGTNVMRVERTVVAHNSGAAFGCEGVPALTVVCSDVFGNTNDEIVGCGTDLGSNFNADPLFCDPAAGDFRLRAGSPCTANSSPPGCSLVGAFDEGCVDAVLPATWGALKSRFLDNGGRP